MRRPKWARRSDSSSFCRSAGSLLRNSLGFIGLSSEHPLHDDGAERQLGRGELEGLLGKLVRHAVHLEDDLAGLDLAHEVLRVALAVAHAHFGGLRRHRLVWEDADPDAAAALDVARHGTAPGFELARGEPAAGRGLQAKFAEGHLGAARGDTGVAAFLLFSVFGACRLQHGYSFFSPSGFSIFFGRLTVVFGAAAPSFLAARGAPSGRGRPAPRFWPGRGAGFLARLGSAGASGCGVAGAAPGINAGVSPFGAISPL